MENKSQVNERPKDSVEKMNNLVKSLANKPLDQISVNPFINRPKFSNFDYIMIYGLGTILAVIRIFPMGLISIFAGLMAAFFMSTIKLFDLMKISTITLKLVAKHTVYGILRIALFFSGFYWIKVIDKSPPNQPKATKPTIIPIAPHTSFFDIVAMIKLGAPSIVSRYENSRYPLVRSIISLCEPVFVKREDRDSRLKAADEIKQAALVGKIMLFPEGTCTNATSLIQFKLGAFLPQLPVQPVVIKWKTGKHNLRSWVEEGAGFLKVIFYTLGQFWNSCQIVKLAPYIPNEEEKADTRLFQDNVENLMCEELGILKSFYGYGDVMFLGFAREIGIFRSPVCIKLLCICYRMLKEKTQDPEGSSLNKTIKTPKFAPIFSPTYLGLGEDFGITKVFSGIYRKFAAISEHISSVPDFYVPKALLKMTKRKKEILKRKMNDNPYVKPLPMSGVIRNKFDASQTTPQIAITSDVANEKRLVYETFGVFIEKCINDIEEKGEIRPIESTTDLAKLLGLDDSSKINKSSVLVDLLKAIEYLTVDGPTTLHLLSVLHLCDCREPNLWERIRTVIYLLSFQMKVVKTEGQIKPESEPKLDLQNFRLFLWYSLGIQQFNEKFLSQKEFDFDYIKNNLKVLFKKAVSENGQSLD